MAWMVAGSASIITTPGSKSSQSGGVLSGGVLFVYTQADKKFVIFLFPNVVCYYVCSFCIHLATFVSACICICLRVSTCICMRLSPPLYWIMSASACMHLYLRASVFVYVRASVCVRLCAFALVCVQNIKRQDTLRRKWINVSGRIFCSRTFGMYIITDKAPAPSK